MADTKISALTAGTALAGTEEIPGVQSATTVKFTPAQIRTYVQANMTAATITGGTVTDPATPLTITQTWNDAADTFRALTVNVTDTASASTSALLELQVGGSYRVRVRKDGMIQWSTTVGHYVSGTSDALVIGHEGSNYIGWTKFDYSTMRSSYQFGWTSTSAAGNSPDIALGRNAAGVVEINNGTAGTFRDLYVRNARLNPTAVASLVAASTAGKGSLAYVTDANATTPRSTVAGGGANEVLVMSNGTNWLIVA